MKSYLALKFEVLIILWNYGYTVWSKEYTVEVYDYPCGGMRAILCNYGYTVWSEVYTVE